MDAACRVTLPGGLDPTALPLMVAAAREALAPIRDWYECRDRDMADLRALIYTSEELTNE